MHSWCTIHPNFASALKKCRRFQAQAIADDTVDIADSAAARSEATNSSVPVYGARVRIGARQWLASRYAPDLFGEQSSVTVQGSVDHNHTVSRPGKIDRSQWIAAYNLQPTAIDVTPDKSSYESLPTGTASVPTDFPPLSLPHDDKYK